LNYKTGIFEDGTFSPKYVGDKLLKFTYS